MSHELNKVLVFANIVIYDTKRELWIKRASIKRKKILFHPSFILWESRMGKVEKYGKLSLG